MERLRGLNGSLLAAVIFITAASLLLPSCQKKGKLQPVQWREPKLLSLDSLLLRFRGKALGTVELSYESQGDASREVGRQVFDLSRAIRLSQELYGCKVSFPIPLSDSVAIRLLQKIPGELMPARKPGTVTFTVSPIKIANKILSSVEVMKGEKFDKYLGELNELRTEYMRKTEATSRFVYRIKGRRSLSILTKKLGIDEDQSQVLKAFLSRLAEGSSMWKLSMSKRIYPLVAAEAAMSSHLGLLSPWGKVSRALGISYKVNLHMLAENGWTWLSRVRLARKVQRLGRPEFEVDEWKQFATEELLRTARRNQLEGALFLAYKSFVGYTDEVQAAPEDFVSSMEVHFESKEDSSGRWPPKEARFDMLLRSFSRGAVFYISVNGKYSFHLMNNAYSVVKEADFLQRDTLHVSVPIDVNALLPYSNKVTIRLLAAPYENSPLPVRVAEMALKLRH